MIKNTEKFKSMILQKPGNTEIRPFQIDGKIRNCKVCQLIGVRVDSKLTFDDLMFDLRNKTSRQLNAFSWLKRHFVKTSSKALEEAKNIYEHYLQIILNDCEYKTSEYETPAEISGKTIMKIKKLNGQLATKIFYSVNRINLNFMKTKHFCN